MLRSFVELILVAWACHDKSCLRKSEKVIGSYICAFVLVDDLVYSSLAASSVHLARSLVAMRIRNTPVRKAHVLSIWQLDFCGELRHRFSLIWWCVLFNGVCGSNIMPN